MAKLNVAIAAFHSRPHPITVTYESGLGPNGKFSGGIGAGGIGLLFENDDTLSGPIIEGPTEVITVSGEMQLFMHYRCFSRSREHTLSPP